MESSKVLQSSVFCYALAGPLKVSNCTHKALRQCDYQGILTFWPTIAFSSPCFSSMIFATERIETMNKNYTEPDISDSIAFPVFSRHNRTRKLTQSPRPLQEGLTRQCSPVAVNQMHQSIDLVSQHTITMSHLGITSMAKISCDDYMPGHSFENVKSWTW